VIIHVIAFPLLGAGSHRAAGRRCCERWLVFDDFAGRCFTSTFLWINAFRDVSGIAFTSDDPPQPVRVEAISKRPASRQSVRRFRGWPIVHTVA
jgi:hypothetical protein